MKAGGAMLVSWARRELAELSILWFAIEGLLWRAIALALYKQSKIGSIRSGLLLLIEQHFVTKKLILKVYKS